LILLFVGRSYFLRVGNMFCETLQLGLIKNLGVDYAYQQRLNRSLAKPIYDSFGGSSGHTLPGLGGSIDESTIVNAVGHVAFFFKPAQDRSNRGVLEGPVQLFPDLVRCDRTHTPDYEQNVSFQFAQLGWIMIRGGVTVHSVTDCNTIPSGGRKLIFGNLILRRLSA
jgi:hypothetical protein